MYKVVIEYMIMMVIRNDFYNLIIIVMIVKIDFYNNECCKLF